MSGMSSMSGSSMSDKSKMYSSLVVEQTIWLQLQGNGYEGRTLSVIALKTGEASASILDGTSSSLDLV